MIEVPLVRGQRGELTGRVALIDPDDAHLLRFRWYERPNGYVMRFKYVDGKQRRIRLSREVMGLAHDDPREVDHVNRDLLNNTRTNLRVVEHAQNMQNQGSRKGSQSLYRGVAFDRRRGRWRATAKLNYVAHFLGDFATELDAARAAEAFRLEHMPYAVPDPALAAYAHLPPPERRHGRGFAANPEASRQAAKKKVTCPHCELRVRPCVLTRHLAARHPEALGA